jgi:ribose transport system substrate-binding protein
MMRSIKTVLACISCAVSLVAHAAAPAPNWLPQPLPKPLGSISVGFSNLGSGVNGYVATYLDAFKKYSSELGIKTVILDAQVDPAKQADQINNLLAQHVDVAIAWPVNAVAVVPALRKAKEANLPVVVTNSNVSAAGAPYYDTFSGPNNYTEAQEAAKLMVKGLNGKGNVVIINGTPGYTTSQEREKGFLDYIAKYPEIKVLDKQPANWSTEKAQSVMENYIVRFGNKIDGVYSADAGMGMGALNAVKAAVSDKKIAAHHVILTDCSITGAAYDAIKAGDYYGSVLQSPEEDARAAIRSAVLIAEGEKLPKTVYFDTPAVTKDNIDKFSRPTF